MSSLNNVVDTLLEDYVANGVIHTYDVEQLVSVATFRKISVAKFRGISHYKRTGTEVLFMCLSEVFSLFAHSFF